MHQRTHHVFHTHTKNQSQDGIERRDLLFSRSAGLALLGAATMITSPALAETTKTKKVSASKVRETANGVKYVDVAKGDGLSPKSGDFVVVSVCYTRGLDGEWHLYRASLVGYLSSRAYYNIKFKSPKIVI